MHPVGANGMTPALVTRDKPERVVLLEHMVLAFIIHEPVRIVDPVFCRRVMELGAIRFLVGWLDLGTSRIRVEQRGCKCRDA